MELRAPQRQEGWGGAMEVVPKSDPFHFRVSWDLLTDFNSRRFLLSSARLEQCQLWGSFQKSLQRQARARSWANVGKQ